MKPSQNTRYGHAEQHRTHRQDVEGGSSTHGCDDPRGHPDYDGENERRKRELGRRREILREFGRDGLRVDERTSEIAVEYGCDVEAELHVERFIESECRAQRRDFGGGRMISEPQRHGIARDRVHECEADERDRREYEHEAHGAPRDESCHAALTAESREPRRARPA